MRATGRHRGIVPIVSALILVTIVVVFGSIVFTFSNTILAEREAAQQEQFVVDNVWFQKQGYVNISIYNHGDARVEMASVYIYNATAAAEGGNTAHAHRTLSVLLEPDQRLWVNVDYSWESDQVYSIKVASSKGNSYESYWKA